MKNAIELLKAEFIKMLTEYTTRTDWFDYEKMNAYNELQGFDKALRTLGVSRDEIKQIITDYHARRKGLK
jgi:hypothetical protein